MFCKPLTTTTKAGDIMAMVSSFFEEEKVSWAQLIGVCTDGAPSMLCSKSGLYLTLLLCIPTVTFCVVQFIRLSILGFVTLVKEKNPNVITTHCLIHREALASKTLPAALKGILDSVIQIINHIKGGALNTQLFHQLCRDMDSSHQDLLFYTAVHWLSKGNVLSCIYELLEEMEMFLEAHVKKTERF